ncbi:MAG: molybdenum ABC transporter ATP-binding protein [Tagaea sp. CACIAM 22H2]|nr:molybdenum ABC transporter ATP-binding protein [Tagaea sp. CACIAM 22H2]
MIELDIRTRLGDFTLNAKLQAPSDGVLALFGRSGSGKTSILRALAGLARPDQGRIALGGDVLFDSAKGIDVPAEKRRLGYVFQESRLFPHLDVAANLRYGAKRAPGGERRADFDAIVALLGIEALLPRKPIALSGGERQRVAIGRALLARPQALLMDEPLASLDAARKAELLPYLDRLQAEAKLPIVYVSHAADEVMRLADRIALIDGGTVRVIGTAAEIALDPGFAVIAGRFDSGGVLETAVAAHLPDYALTRLHFAGGTLDVPAIDAAPGTRVRVHVRARDVMVATKKPEGLSARNAIEATIARVTPSAAGPDAELALIAGDQTIAARVTRASVAELGLREGMPVYAILKSVAVGKSDATRRD